MEVISYRNIIPSASVSLDTLGPFFSTQAHSTNFTKAQFMCHREYYSTCEDTSVALDEKYTNKVHKSSILQAFLCLE